MYVTVQNTQNKFGLISIDPVAKKIVNQVDVPALTPLHYAAGSVWLPGLETDANGHNCSVTRFDGKTLAKQATIQVNCSSFGNAPPTATDGDAVWFADTSKVNLTTDKGAVMTRIDPATNAPGTSVPMPFSGGYAVDSQGALFYEGNLTQGDYRLTTGASAFESLGTIQGTPRPGGAGLWTSSSDHKSARYFTQAGTPQVTLQIDGSVVAGDATGAYVEVEGNDASGHFAEQLWRYPADGSTPVQLAFSPTTDGGPLSYFGDPLPISNGHGLLKLWSTHSGSNQRTQILLQWVPVK